MLREFLEEVTCNVLDTGVAGPVACVYHGPEATAFRLVPSTEALN
jgi:hypothetical protein